MQSLEEAYNEPKPLWSRFIVEYPAAAANFLLFFLAAFILKVIELVANEARMDEEPIIMVLFMSVAGTIMFLSSEIINEVAMRFAHTVTMRELNGYKSESIRGIIVALVLGVFVIYPNMEIILSIIVVFITLWVVLYRNYWRSADPIIKVFVGLYLVIILIHIVIFELFLIVKFTQFF